MRIIRFPHLTESQFLGCNSAFVDSLFGELNSAGMFLRQLEGKSKGAAFAHEMSFDAHRYGALMVLDRWAALVKAFGPHLALSRHPEIVAQNPERMAAAEDILGRANRLIDSADAYARELVDACIAAFQSMNTTFRQERAAAEQSSRLGPMLPEEFREARRIFLEDLAER